jgi:hypothetical protein
MKDKFKRAIFNQIWNYIINNKKSFYLDLIEKLNMFDLTNFDDILEVYPNFKLEGIYLAGGMDKAVDVGAGWRFIVEQEFETYKRHDSDLPKIDFKSGGKEIFPSVNPCRVVEGEFLNMYLQNKKAAEKLYSGRPLVLNPVRKEVDRTKDIEFAKAASKYKTFTQETPVDEYQPTMDDIRRTLSKTIEPDDEQLVRLTDATLLGLNKTAGSGTYGETETLSYMNKPIFVWMTDPGWKFEDFSMWTFPHFTKFARNNEEMKKMVKAMIDFAEK